MESFLKQYRMVLHTVGPVFVGTGKQLDKKEYVLKRDTKEVIVFELGKMYMQLEKRCLGQQFQQYLLGNNKSLSRLGLGQWFSENHISPKEYGEWVRYKINCGDLLLEKKPINVCECIKDSNDKPYIPGSSIKGMLRTVLLSYFLYHANNREKWSVKIDSGTHGYHKPNRLLQQEVREMENQFFHTLHRKNLRGEEVDIKNAVNDVMSGFIVSDSDCLCVEDLVLCQKRDENPEGKAHNINILREAIKPDVDISFTVTIDSRICPFTKQDIVEAVKFFSARYYSEFLSKFASADYPSGNTVWLGGGSGFHTKTVMNSLFDGRRALETTSRVLSIKRDSKNKKDIQLGISPHIVKYTNYQGKRLQFGQCELIICD